MAWDEIEKQTLVLPFLFLHSISDGKKKKKNEAQVVGADYGASMVNDVSVKKHIVDVRIEKTYNRNSWKCLLSLHRPHKNNLRRSYEVFF